MWKVNEGLHEYFGMHTVIQNDDGDYSQSMRQYIDQKGLVSHSSFSKKLANGEVVKRCWLIYSKSTGHVYSVACKLYGRTAALGILMIGKTPTLLMTMIIC